MMFQSNNNMLDLMCSQAVNAIVSGRYDESIDLLTKALTAIQQEQIVSSTSTEMQQSRSSHPEGVVLQVLQYYRVDMEDESSPSQIHSFDHPSEPKIFAAPLTAPSSADLQYQACTSEQYQFIITYNLALSHHLCAMERRDVNKLEVAVGLWDIIYRFHWNEDLGLVTFHTCAILNNYGHGLRQIGAEKSAQECFESLLCALCVYVQKGHRSDLDACRTDCFFQSVTTLVLKDPQTASAA